MNTIKTMLRGLAIGEAQQNQHLVLFPLIAPTESPRGYDTLDEALAKDGIDISEISEGGSVPDLLLKNRLDKDVLLIDGEELVGAKQNRVLNVTVLAAANSEIRLPVSCVEAGRWGYQERRFRTSGNAHFAKGRARRMASVSANMAASGDKYSDQGEVWDSISVKGMRMDSYSSTSAMGDIYQDYRAPLEDYVESAKAQPTQVGAVFAIDGEIRGLEVFESPEVFSKLLPKLVRSYGLDALEIEGDPKPAPQLNQVRRLLDEVSHAEASVHHGVGKGNDVRIANGELQAGALLYEGRVLHLVGFRMDRLR